MKIAFAVPALLLALGSAAFAQGKRRTNASLIGNYVVTGTETNGKKYDGSGPLAVTMDKNGALELKWDGGKYVGIGQVVGDKLLVGSVRRRPDGDRHHGHQGRRLAGGKILAPHRPGHRRHRGLEEAVRAFAAAASVRNPPMPARESRVTR